MLVFVLEMMLATFCPHRQSFSNLCLAYIQTTVCSSPRHTMCPSGSCHLTTLSARSLLLESLFCSVEPYSAIDSPALWGLRSPVLGKKRNLWFNLFAMSSCRTLSPWKTVFFLNTLPFNCAFSCYLCFRDLSHSEVCFQRCLKVPVKVSRSIHVTTGFFELRLSALGTFKTLKIFKKDENSQEAGTIIQNNHKLREPVSALRPSLLPWPGSSCVGQCERNVHSLQPASLPLVSEAKGTWLWWFPWTLGSPYPQFNTHKWPMWSLSCPQLRSCGSLLVPAVSAWTQTSDAQQPIARPPRHYWNCQLYKIYDS